MPRREMETPPSTPELVNKVAPGAPRKRTDNRPVLNGTPRVIDFDGREESPSLALFGVTIVFVALLLAWGAFI